MKTAANLIVEAEQPGEEAGDIYLYNDGEIVLVNGVARGGSTWFFWAPEDLGGDGGLYYFGENPENSSDGMELDEPWVSAQKLDQEPVRTDKKYQGAIPNFDDKPSQDDPGGAQSESMQQRMDRANQLVSKLLEI